MAVGVGQVDLSKGWVGYKVYEVGCAFNFDVFDLLRGLPACDRGCGIPSPVVASVDLSDPQRRRSVFSAIPAIYEMASISKAGGRKGGSETRLYLNVATSPGERVRDRPLAVEMRRPVLGDLVPAAGAAQVVVKPGPAYSV